MEKLTEMAENGMLQGPAMDWTEDDGLHIRVQEWREEVELMLSG